MTGIQTVDLWSRKRLLYQLSHNHCPCQIDICSFPPSLSVLIERANIKGNITKRVTEQDFSLVDKLSNDNSLDDYNWVLLPT